MPATRAYLEDIDIEEVYRAIKGSYHDTSWTLTTFRLIIINELGLVFKMADMKDLVATFKDMDLVEEQGKANKKPCYKIL